MKGFSQTLYFFSLLFGTISQNKFSNIYASEQIKDVNLEDPLYIDQNNNIDKGSSLLIGILDQSALMTESQQIKFINQRESMEINRIEEEIKKLGKEFRDYTNEVQEKMNIASTIEQKKMQENYDRRTAIFEQQQRALDAEKLEVKTKRIKAVNDLIQIWVKKAIDKNKLNVNCVLLYGVGYDDQVGSVINYNTNSNNLIDITNYVIEVSIEDWYTGVEIPGSELDLKQEKNEENNY